VLEWYDRHRAYYNIWFKQNSSSSSISNTTCVEKHCIRISYFHLFVACRKHYHKHSYIAKFMCGSGRLMQALRHRKFLFVLKHLRLRKACLKTLLVFKFRRRVSKVSFFGYELANKSVLKNIALKSRLHIAQGLISALGKWQGPAPHSKDRNLLSSRCSRKRGFSKTKCGQITFLKIGKCKGSAVLCIVPCPPPSCFV